MVSAYAGRGSTCSHLSLNQSVRAASAASFEHNQVVCCVSRTHRFSGFELPCAVILPRAQTGLGRGSAAGSWALPMIEVGLWDGTLHPGETGCPDSVFSIFYFIIFFFFT